MAKISNSYEHGRIAAFRHWLQNGSDALDTAMQDAYTAGSNNTDIENAHRRAEEDAARREERRLSLELQSKRIRQRFDNISEKRSRFNEWLFRILAVLLCAGIIGVLVAATHMLPSFGSPNAPANNEVPARYIEKGMEETGAVNIVAGMILDYRAFDTLGESNVLFVAACTVIILLRLAAGDKNSSALLAEMADDRSGEFKDDIILQHIAKLLTPVALLFGMYVIMNGHISPGGGFSGGAVMGAGLILYLAAYGFAKTERFFTFTTFRVVSVCALSFYALSKCYSFFTGANHLPSVITPGTPGMLFSAGLIPYLNLAVGLVVCCTMYAFYTLFRKGDL